MNVLDKSAIRDCTSCQLCATVCAHKAIKIEVNENGFYRPVINTNLCNDCSLCTKICYKFDETLKITTTEQLSRQKLYSAWSNDDQLIKSTTSGGIGDLLAHELLKEGYKIVGCVYNDDKVRAEHRIATNELDLIPFRGSKYIQSYTFDALKEVVKNCRNEKYAIFGTPCQIYALNKIAEMKKNRDNFFFVDLYCHGTPSLHVWKKFQDNIKKTLSIKHFDRVEFRSKLEGWGGRYLIAIYVDGKIVFRSKKNLKGFYELFFSDQVLNDGCNKCLLRSTHEYTDIRLGDFWGKKYLDNYRGVSAVSIITERATNLFEKIKKQDVTTEPCDYSEFLPFQSWGKIHNPRPISRTAILLSLKDPKQTIYDACNALHKTQPLKIKLVRYTKNILALFPIRAVNMLKKIM